MKELICLISLLIVGMIASNAQTSEYDQQSVINLNIKTLGAVGDGLTNNQAIIQSNIDNLSGKGGGILYFPAGTWLTGDISLRDFVILKFDRGCTLKGDISIRDIRNTGIIGEESDKLNIEGKIRFNNSRNIELKNIFSRHGWGIHECQGVRIDRVKIEQEMRRQPNGLAITCHGCKDVYVTNSELTCNDDAWCLKRSGENIHISKSIICGRQAASFKIGTETDGVFKNITVTDCIIYNSTRAGINIEAVDGSSIDGVFISHVRMYDVAAPLYIQLGNRNRYGDKNRNDKDISEIKNITIFDVEFYGTRNDDDIGSSIMGMQDHPIENVTISRVHFNYKGGGTKADASCKVPELPEFYPEFDIYGTLPAYGIYSRHVNGLVLEDVTLSFSEADLRPAIICDDVQNLVINRLNAKTYIAYNQYSPPFENSEPTIRLNQVRHASILYCQAPVFSSLVKLEGERTSDISLDNNDISLSQLQPFQIADEVKANIILQPLAQVEYSNLQSADPVKTNEPIPVKLVVHNKGKSGYANVIAFLDQIQADSKWIWLDTYEDREVELLIPDGYHADKHQVTIGNLKLNVNVVPSPARLVFSDLQVPTTGKTGNPVPIEVTVQNVGSEAKEAKVVFSEKGNELAAKYISLLPGEKVIIRTEAKFTTGGIHEVTIGECTAAISINPIWIDQNKNGVIDIKEKSFDSFFSAIGQAGPGDVIMVLPGNYNIKADQLPILINKRGLTIRSAFGPDCTTIQVEGANQDLIKQQSLFLLKADGITIDGLTMKAANYNICADSVRDCIIKNNIFNFSKLNHIYLVNSSGIKVQNNHGRAALYSFLLMENCDNCLIEENHILGDPCGFKVDSCKNNLFRKNHFDGLAWYGITLTNSTDNIIERNLFMESRIEGLELRGASLRNLVTGNTFRNQKNSAILIDGESRDNKINRNSITGNRGMGVTNETIYKVDAINNWWGSSDGPSGANKGSGDPVDKNVGFMPWLTKPLKQ